MDDGGQRLFFTGLKGHFTVHLNRFDRNRINYRYGRRGRIFYRTERLALNGNHSGSRRIAGGQHTVFIYRCNRFIIRRPHKGIITWQFRAFRVHLNGQPGFRSGDHALVLQRNPLRIISHLDLNCTGHGLFAERIHSRQRNGCRSDLLPHRVHHAVTFFQRNNRIIRSLPLVFHSLALILISQHRQRGAELSFRCTVEHQSRAAEAQLGNIAGHRRFHSFVGIIGRQLGIPLSADHLRKVFRSPIVVGKIIFRRTGIGQPRCITGTSGKRFVPDNAVLVDFHHIQFFFRQINAVAVTAACAGTAVSITIPVGQRVAFNVYFIDQRTGQLNTGMVDIVDNVIRNIQTVRADHHVDSVCGIALLPDIRNVILRNRNLPDILLGIAVHMNSRNRTILDIGNPVILDHNRPLRIVGIPPAQQIDALSLHGKTIDGQRIVVLKISHFNPTGKHRFFGVGRTAHRIVSDLCTAQGDIAVDVLGPIAIIDSDLFCVGSSRHSDHRRFAVLYRVDRGLDRIKIRLGSVNLHFNLRVGS